MSNYLKHLRTWHHSDMDKDFAEEFKGYLNENDLPYEPSEAGDKVHFAVYMNDYEAKAANDWIDVHLFRKGR